MNDAINQTACETLFTQARTHNGWLDKPVSDAQLQAVWFIASFIGSPWRPAA